MPFSDLISPSLSRRCMATCFSLRWRYALILPAGVMLWALVVWYTGVDSQAGEIPAPNPPTINSLPNKWRTISRLPLPLPASLDAPSFPRVIPRLPTLPHPINQVLSNSRRATAAAMASTAPPQDPVLHTSTSLPQYLTKSVPPTPAAPIAPSEIDLIYAAALANTLARFPDHDHI